MPGAFKPSTKSSKQDTYLTTKRDISTLFSVLKSKQKNYII